MKKFVVLVVVLLPIFLFNKVSASAPLIPGCDMNNYNYSYYRGEEEYVEIEEEGFTLDFTSWGAVWLQKRGFFIQEVCIEIQSYSGEQITRIFGGGDGALMYVHQGDIELIALRVIEIQHQVFLPLILK